MAGGSGTRFWPKSRVAKPKQFLRLVGEKTMLQQTVARVSSMVPPERVLIITNKSYTALVQQQLPEVPAENIIGEPVGRNTAPVAAAAAAIIEARTPGASMAVLPSDHYIRDEATFCGILASAFAKAEAGHNLVTIGIRPYRPETGFGYIQTVAEKSEMAEGNPVHEVKRFAEKPDLKTAVSFLESGDFLWNSGMFVWRSDVILDEFRLHLPELHSLAITLQEALAGGMSVPDVEAFYQAAPSVSVDYGIMEKASTVHVLPGEFGWNDVGSWQAIYELQDKDEAGNVTDAAEVLMTGCKDSYVYSRSGRLISLVGLDGIGVVETDDALMVCRIEKSQDVREIVAKLQEEPWRKYR
ncbi:mannose-1-phosphate guanylyltransferase [Cyclonatronum proteinivorum]|uniref:mannose-1-phosphate guanylyltransferase n=2 Tax=Cyclonatronum proteinivorum TaxID=1457365 RepID=A0A345UNI5_9BACT|nr:mannose-1-phosphate guanylyltransferase [Cyclonatronum proteinivorum]